MDPLTYIIPDKLKSAFFSHTLGTRRMVINLFLGIYIAQAEDEEFSVVYAV